MAMSSSQIRSKVHGAMQASGVPTAEVANLLRANFERGTPSFRWVNDLFAGKPVSPLGGSDASVGVFVEFLSAPSQASAAKAKKALDKAAGGKTPATPRVQTVPGSPRVRVTTGGGIEQKPRGGKAQFIKPRLPAGSSVQALSAKQRWDDAIARGADPIDATRRRIAATADKAKLAGVVVMLNSLKPKAGKKPTRAQIKSLAEAAEKKSGYKPPKKPTTKKPPKKPATKPKVTAPKPVKAKKRVSGHDFPIWATVWNSKCATKNPVANFLKVAIRSRSKDRLKEAIALLKTVGSGAKGKERSLFQSATRDLTKRLKSVSPRAKAPGRKTGATGT